ncbi:MAG TPA: hypothetical protein VGI97_00475 [Gemmatimonadaceae bacterium]|jgi:hypothetical protein
MSAELLDAAREYSIANERYHVACLRIAMARNKENVPSEEWDEATRAACTAANNAQSKLTDLCSRLFPQPMRAEVWKEYSEHFWPTKATAPYCPRCNGHHEREGDAEEKCQRGMQFANADHRRRGGTI